MDGMGKSKNTGSHFWKNSPSPAEPARTSAQKSSHPLSNKGDIFPLAKKTALPL
jgi:hypothetical protein